MSTISIEFEEGDARLRVEIPVSEEELRLPLDAFMAQKINRSAIAVLLDMTWRKKLGRYETIKEKFERETGQPWPIPR